MENLIFDQRKRKAYLRSESHLDDLIDDYLEEGLDYDKALEAAIKDMEANHD